MFDGSMCGGEGVPSHRMPGVWRCCREGEGVSAHFRAPDVKPSPTRLGRCLFGGDFLIGNHGFFHLFHALLLEVLLGGVAVV